MAIGTTAALIGASLVGTAAQVSSANKAKNAVTQAAQSDLQLKERIYGEQKELFQPFYADGVKAQNALNYEMGLGEKPEGYGGFTATPGYDFRLSEGQRAIDNSAASRNSLYSGNTLKALSTYGQNTGAAEYGNYFNRLGQMASSGQAAASGQQAAGNAYSAGAGNAFDNMGNAAAAGAIGTGNAFSGGISNVTGILGYQNALNQQQGLTGTVATLNQPWGPY